MPIKPMEDFSENGGSNFFAGRPIAKVHNFYLSGEIKDPSEYIQWFDLIRNASEMDVIYLRINSGGGDLFTAIQFIRVMRESSARIVVSVEGLCASAATLILLSAQNHEITPHSVFMFHNASMMSVGKVGEMYAHITHLKDWVQKVFNEFYSVFLTPEEIQQLIIGQDLYMGADEVVTRLKTRNVELEKLAAKGKNLTNWGDENIAPPPVAKKGRVKKTPKIKKNRQSPSQAYRYR